MLVKVPPTNALKLRQEDDMKTRRAITALIMGLSVAGCSTPETATRNAPLETTSVSVAAPAYAIQEIRVNVPKSLKVSEANRYLPGGDIVWREDPAGDRHAQVKAIFKAAMQQGVNAMRSGHVPAVLDIQVTRFHALTEKARYTVGGVHALQFRMLLRNPETGVAYGAPQSRGLSGGKPGPDGGAESTRCFQQKLKRLKGTA
ncbi:DUF6778 family protein [Roseovarius sp. B08]|uniref:DUF6778 family protein n=1 Tax=Roseovarius sp. B08 TaxID=3449223 RepID=UPI003EDC907F